MNLIGLVTVVDENKRTARVTFKSLNNSTSYLIAYARHIGSLQVNDLVAVMFFSSNMADGLIIGIF